MQLIHVAHLPSTGRDHRTNDKSTPPDNPIVKHVASTREIYQAGQAASYSVTKGTRAKESCMAA